MGKISLVPQHGQELAQRLGGFVCGYCGRPLARHQRGQPWTGTRINIATIDHIIPISNGGTDAPNNLMLACLSCNTEKGKRTLDEYRILVSRSIPDGIAARFYFECLNHQLLR